jgi:acetyl esterase/lipase
LTLVFALSVAIGAGFLLLSHGRAAVKATLFLFEFFPVLGVQPLKHVTRPPTLERVLLPRNQGEAPADLYRPGRPGSFGALVLILGVNPLDLRDPLVMQLARSLARLDVIVLIPESPELKAGQISVSEVDAIVAAVEYLQQLPGARSDRIGLAGFSVGASLAVLAAADERIAGDLAVVNLFGPYADVRSLLRAVLTEQQPLDGSTVAWIPSDFSRDIVQRLLLEAVEDDHDRLVLQQAILKGDERATGLVTEHGRVVAALLDKPAPEEVEQLLDALPPTLARRLDGLSPVRVSQRVHARVFLMHDRDDAFVPYTESRRLRDALPLGSLARYEEFDLFAHVVPDSDGRLSLAGDIIRFWAYLAHLLSYVTS